MNDEALMRRAISLARRALGRTGTNPMVGCVLVKGGTIVGEGWHEGRGKPHAEPRALKAAGAKREGATAYVTLEPCVGHPGKLMPPCAPQLAAAGVRHVVIGALDPNPAVRGRGVRFLRSHGIKVTVGVCRDEAEWLIRGFSHRMTRQRPWVTLKMALSLDGKAYTDNGKSKWITSAAARREGRRLRAGNDAILVGINTIVQDNPSLTARGGGKDPIRVILDSSLRTPARAKALPAWIFTASKKTHPNAETIRIDPRNLKAVLRELARRGVNHLLVEGGPAVWASFLSRGLVDEAAIFLAPKLLRGAHDPNAAPMLRAPTVSKVGADFLFCSSVH